MRAVAAILLAAAAVQQVIAQGTAVDTTTYNNIIQYTRFARASYAFNCATPPNGSTILQYFRDSSTGASATLFQWDAGKQIVLSWKGTSTPADWNTDLDFPLTALTAPGASCSSCQVHEGFQKLHNALAPAAISAVKAAITSTGYDFVLTGHSLGGALASIATSSFGASGVKVAATYTYGEPRNGNSAFGSYVLSFTSNYYRVTHSNDGVPSIPPSIIGFSHHGNEYWEKNTGYNNTQASTVMCASVAGQEPLNCNLGTSSGDNPINYAHVTYSNDVIGNPLHIHDCGASYP